MITAEFFADCEGRLKGFHITGHSGMAEYGEDVLCAFVSSAAYMVANTVTDIIHVQAEVRADDGDMYVMADEKYIDDCQAVLAGLKLHLQQTEEQYPKNLKVITTEV